MMDKQKYFVTPLSYSIHKEKENSIFGYNVLITLDDEAAGFFVVIETDDGTIRLDPDELEVVYNTAKTMVEQAEANTIKKE